MQIVAYSESDDSDDMGADMQNTQNTTARFNGKTSG